MSLRKRHIIVSRDVRFIDDFYGKSENQVDISLTYSLDMKMDEDIPRVDEALEGSAKEEHLF